MQKQWFNKLGVLNWVVTATPSRYFSLWVSTPSMWKHSIYSSCGWESGFLAFSSLESSLFDWLSMELMNSLFKVSSALIDWLLCHDSSCPGAWGMFNFINLSLLGSYKLLSDSVEIRGYLHPRLFDIPL